jgi:ectoine hydroxylase-related dioxygenase (phytanoyl-CoA dioxygenase family)
MQPLGLSARVPTWLKTRPSAAAAHLHSSNVRYTSQPLVPNARTKYVKAFSNTQEDPDVSKELTDVIRLASHKRTSLELSSHPPSYTPQQDDNCLQRSSALCLVEKVSPFNVAALLQRCRLCWINTDAGDTFSQIGCLSDATVVT